MQFIGRAKEHTHCARCSQQILTCMNVTRYLSLSYSTRNPFMMDTKKEISRAFSHYYYYLLLFLHSFIAPYQLTKAPFSFSPRPLASSLFRGFPSVLLHYISFAADPVPPALSRRQSWRRPPFLTFSRCSLYIHLSHHFSYLSMYLFSAVILCSLYIF
jgi:hypothetical protein